nr:MAG TPA: hypothetical protein [Caudoviricetes sp.]
MPPLKCRHCCFQSRFNSINRIRDSFIVSLSCRHNSYMRCVFRCRCHANANIFATLWKRAISTTCNRHRLILTALGITNNNVAALDEITIKTSHVENDTSHDAIHVIPNDNRLFACIKGICLVYAIHKLNKN